MKLILSRGVMLARVVFASLVASTNPFIIMADQVAAPTFNPPAPHTFAGTSVEVTISCATVGATVYYSTDGTEPTTNSSLFTVPLIFSAPTTLKAKGFKIGWTASAVTTGAYSKAGWTENWVRLSSGVPKQIALNTSVVGGFISVPSGQGELTVTVANVSYIDLYGNPVSGVYDLLGRLGSAPHGTYPGTILVPDPGVFESGALLPLRIQNPSPGDYFVAAYSFYQGKKVSSYTLIATYLPTAPVITAQPQSRTADVGDSVSFGVTATGQSLTYQWYKNNTAIGGANGAIYTISNVQTGDAGDYKVKVTNPGGSKTSALATLAVTVDISVTVQSNPSSSSFIVDGTTYTTSQTFTWASGSSHTMSTTSPQSGGTGVQYVWSSWSDGGAISHILAPTSGTTYTANFTTQYYLTMSAGAGGNVSPSSAWKNSGTVVPIGATVSGGYSFSGWTGSGSGSYSGSSSSASVTMNGPITETGNFITVAPARLNAVQQGNNLVLTWATNDPAFSLEYATNLPASIWTSNSVSPSIVSGQNTVTNTMTNRFRLYRLKK